MEQGLLIDVPPHLGVEDENQRYTIRRAREWVLRAANVSEFDLDVAACAESHHAHLWYGVAENGLSLPWFGNVFCNPPWSDVWAWVVKARQEFDADLSGNLISVSMLLPGDRTHRPWWRDLIEPIRDGRGTTGPTIDTHFAPERFPYGGPGNPDGVGCAEPNFTSVLLVWRPRRVVTSSRKMTDAASARRGATTQAAVTPSPPSFSQGAASSTLDEPTPDPESLRPIPDGEICF